MRWRRFIWLFFYLCSLYAYRMFETFWYSQSGKIDWVIWNKKLMYHFTKFAVFINSSATTTMVDYDISLQNAVQMPQATIFGCHKTILICYGRLYVVARYIIALAYWNRGQQNVFVLFLSLLLFVIIIWF